MIHKCVHRLILNDENSAVLRGIVYGCATRAQRVTSPGTSAQVEQLHHEEVTSGYTSMILCSIHNTATHRR